MRSRIEENVRFQCGRQWLHATAQERDARDLAWANTLCDIADAMMDVGAVLRATEAWALADRVATGLGLDDVMRRIYTDPLVALVTQESSMMDLLRGRDD